MLLRFHTHVLAAGKNFVPPVLFVPFGERGRHVHLFDNVPPAHARVVGAERNLAFLRCIRDNALLGASEVVIKQVLKPHSRDEQEIPAIVAPLHDIVNRAVRPNLAIVLARCIEVLVELLQQVHQLKMRRRLERIVVLHQTKRHPHHGQKLSPRSIIYFRNILRQLVPMQERRNRNRLLRLLVNHDSHASPTIRVTTAT